MRLKYRIARRIGYTRKRLETRLIYQSVTFADVGKHERFGTPYGGWNIPTSFFDTDSVCYCIGCGEDISFDLILITRFGAQVYSFDPTPKATRHVQSVLENIKKGLPSSTHNHGENMVYEITAEQLERFHFYEFGIWKENATIKLYAPQNPEHASYSALNIQRTEAYIESQCYTLEYTMKQLNHSSLSLLKMNIEGAEYDVLASMLQSEIYPKTLCITFDEGHHPIDNGYVARMKSCLGSLRRVGYRCTHIENWNFTFMRL